MFPLGDSQSNERIKKVRNVVKTILSSLEMGHQMVRDHPVDSWVFEWAVDWIRHAHVGDLGKTAVQLVAQSQAETLHNSARRSCVNC